VSETHTWATLRVVSDSLTPDEISKVLDSSPSMAGVKGELSRLGKPIVANQWLLDTNVGLERDIEDHIRELAEFVSAKAERFRSLVESSAVTLDILCTVEDSLGRSALVLDPDLMSTLALIPIELGVSWTCYSPEHDYAG